jgi:hypothetical protein
MGNGLAILAAGIVGRESRVRPPPLRHLRCARERSLDVAFANDAPGKQWRSAKAVTP